MTKPDTVVSLGGIDFERFEVPEKISLGGAQSLTTHKLVGGSRIIDAMGRDDADLTWSGLFQGSNATARWRALDALRIAGQAIELSWDEFKYSVVIAELTGSFERFYWVPYSIRCTIVEDKVASKPSADPASVDTMMSADASTATDLAGKIGNSGITSAITSVSKAIANVSTFVSATQDTIASVLAPIEAAREQVMSVIGQGETAWLGIEDIGLLGNNLSAAISGQASASTQLTNLYDLHGTLSRMGSNLNSVGATGAVVVQAGGDLYRMAADAYGDATAWVDIARANSLVDPELSGVNTLHLPARPSGSDGVLTQ